MRESSLAGFILAHVLHWSRSGNENVCDSTHVRMGTCKHIRANGNIIYIYIYIYIYVYNLAWSSLRGLWSSESPFRFKNIVVAARVQGALCTTTEALLYGKNDYRLFDSFLLKCSCSLLAGKACKKNEDNTVFKAKSNQQL